MLGVLYNVSMDYESAVECFAKACHARPDEYGLINKVIYS